MNFNWKIAFRSGNVELFELVHRHRAHPMASEYENLDVVSPKCDISHGTWMSVAGIECYPGNAAAAVDSLHWNRL
jgi:hypothetical protein